MKSKLIILLLFICLCSVCLCPVHSAKFNIPYINAPIIDGKVTNEEWGNATLLTSFHEIGSRKTEQNKSVVWYGYDKDKLYVAYRFFGPEYPKGLDRGENGAYWQDDAFELFINNQGSFNQIMANCMGGINKLGLDIEYKTRINDNFEQFGTPISEKYWEGEFSVTWKSLKMSAPKDGYIDRIFFGRDNVSGGAYYSDFGNVYISWFEVDQYSDIVYTQTSPVVQMTDTKIVGNELNIINNNSSKEEAEVTYIVYSEDKEINREEKTVSLNPKEKKTVTSSIDFPKGLFVLDVTVKHKDRILFKYDTEILNVEIFKYDFENNKLSFDFDGSSIPLKDNPFVEIKLQKDGTMVTGYLLNITENSNKFHREIDLSEYEKGNYTLSCWIKNTFMKKWDIDYE